MQFDYKNHYWVTIRDHSITYVRIIFRKTNISNPLILTRTCVLLTRYRTGSNPQYAIPVVWIMILMPIGLHNKLEEWTLINLNQPVLEKKFISWNLVSDIKSGLEEKKSYIQRSVTRQSVTKLHMTRPNISKLFTFWIFWLSLQCFTPL